MSLLLDLKDCVKERGTVSLLDLSFRFRQSPEALRGMMAHWERKGLVRQLSDDEACGSCASASQCGSCTLPVAHETYAWVGG